MVEAFLTEVFLSFVAGGAPPVRLLLRNIRQKAEGKREVFLSCVTDAIAVSEGFRNELDL